MAAVRVRLQLNDAAGAVRAKVWLQLPSRLKLVSDLSEHVTDLYSDGGGSLSLSLDGFELPSSEGIAILRDGDAIVGTMGKPGAGQAGQAGQAARGGAESAGGVNDANKRRKRPRPQDDKQGGKEPGKVATAVNVKRGKKDKKGKGGEGRNVEQNGSKHGKGSKLGENGEKGMKGKKCSASRHAAASRPIAVSSSDGSAHVRFGSDAGRGRDGSSNSSADSESSDGSSNSSADSESSDSGDSSDSSDESSDGSSDDSSGVSDSDSGEAIDAEAKAATRSTSAPTCSAPTSCGANPAEMNDDDATMPEDPFQVPPRHRVDETAPRDTHPSASSPAYAHLAVWVPGMVLHLGDTVHYKTVSLCPETWQPTLSATYRTVVVVAHPSDSSSGGSSSGASTAAVDMSELWVVAPGCGTPEQLDVASLGEIRVDSKFPPILAPVSRTTRSPALQTPSGKPRGRGKRRRQQPSLQHFAGLLGLSPASKSNE